MEQLYFLADLQDLSDVRELPLDRVKDFLKNMHDDKDDDDPFFDEVDEADADRTDEMLAGIDYTIFSSEEDYQYAILEDERKVWVKVETFTAKERYLSFQREFESSLYGPIFVMIRFDHQSVIVFKNHEEKYLNFKQYEKCIRQDQQAINLMHSKDNVIIENVELLNSFFDESVIEDIRDKFKEMLKVSLEG